MESASVEALFYVSFRRERVVRCCMWPLGLECGGGVSCDLRGIIVHCTACTQNAPSTRAGVLGRSWGRPSYEPTEYLALSAQKGADTQTDFLPLTGFRFCSFGLHENKRCNLHCWTVRDLWDIFGMSRPPANAADPAASCRLQAAGMGVARLQASGGVATLQSARLQSCCWLQGCKLQANPTTRSMSKPLCKSTPPYLNCTRTACRRGERGPFPGEGLPFPTTPSACS
jgi:hypothetical protein